MPFKYFVFNVICNMLTCTILNDILSSLLKFIHNGHKIWLRNGLNSLTHWGRVTHICVSKLTIISSDNGLLSGWRQAIIWTNAGKLLFGPPGTNFSEILIEIHTFSFKKMHLKMSSGKWRPFCLSLNVLNIRLSSLLFYDHLSVNTLVIIKQ